MYHYFMFNKPFGCVCARRDDLYPTVMDYFKEIVHFVHDEIQTSLDEIKALRLR